MPIFEYECIECGKHTEHLQLSSDSALTACPQCAGGVRKLMSAPAFQFKGSGWYVTDYAGKGKEPGKSDGNGAEEATVGSSKSTDSGDSSGSDKSSSSSGSNTAPTKSSSTKTSSPSD